MKGRSAMGRRAGVFCAAAVQTFKKALGSCRGEDKQRIRFFLVSFSGLSFNYAFALHWKRRNVTSFSNPLRNVLPFSVHLLRIRLRKVL